MQSTTVIEQGTSLGKDALIRLRKNKMAMAGAIMLLLLSIVALLTPWIAPYSYDAQNLNLGASPPSAAHWLGTDVLGRDQLTRIMYGSRISLMVGFIATSVALLIGVLWGAIAGFFGGRIDALLMRTVDALYALPFTIFIILLTVIFGSSMLLLFLAIGAVEWLTMARIVRGQVLSIKQQEFVEAAVSMGLSRWKIIYRYLIPNVLGPVIVYTTLTIPGVILLESFLSFLGLGIQPPQSSWGSLISSGVETMEEYPWLLLFPALVLSLTLFSLNFLGDGLRDALDPRTSKD
ncbi:ABC transporter permease [Cellvibrio polysaccharolyticus]|uniref:Oligopeptide transport system permease protein OppC n=1 Tax=Cellvibrio polysaccharolyticus TaxID=2082724 RepID=A0A928V2H5_9GAMM|nr:ABC transporter permease [Cellvibrio polysaccharolyticus]MBE8717565.1 ABC transporter permease [Cellvibrio polysaccharolyticus]